MRGEAWRVAVRVAKKFKVKIIRNSWARSSHSAVTNFFKSSLINDNFSSINKLLLFAMWRFGPVEKSVLMIIFHFVFSSRLWIWDAQMRISDIRTNGRSSTRHELRLELFFTKFPNFTISSLIIEHKKFRILFVNRWRNHNWFFHNLMNSERLAPMLSCLSLSSSWS